MNPKTAFKFWYTVKQKWSKIVAKSFQNRVTGAPVAGPTVMLAALDAQRLEENKNPGLWSTRAGPLGNVLGLLGARQRSQNNQRDLLEGS